MQSVLCRVYRAEQKVNLLKAIEVCSCLLSWTLTSSYSSGYDAPYDSLCVVSVACGSPGGCPGVRLDVGCLEQGVSLRSQNPLDSAAARFSCASERYDDARAGGERRRTQRRRGRAL